MGRPMRACSRVDQQSFRKILWPQDYLLEWDDRYSVADIVDINLDIASSSTDVARKGAENSSSLASKLMSVLEFCEDHTGHCPTCSAAMATEDAPTEP